MKKPIAKGAAKAAAKGMAKGMGKPDVVIAIPAKGAKKPNAPARGAKKA
jgi:hypothetical protein